MRLAVQSYCFRKTKSISKLIQQIKSIGVDAVEVCGVHADFRKKKEWQEIVDQFKKSEIDIVSIGVETFTGKKDDEKLFEAAKMARCKHISGHLEIGTYEKAIPMIKDWSRDYRIKVGLHNHGGYQFGGQPDVLDHLIKSGKPQIGLCLDTAWCIQIGPKHGNPTEWVKKYNKNIRAVHLKDFRFEPNGEWIDVIMGAGGLNAPLFLETLAKHDFKGPIILEYEGDPDNPVPTLQTCVKIINTHLGVN